MQKSFRKRAGAKASLVMLSILIFLFLFASAAAAATYGDVNDDGNINVLDVVMVQQHVLGLEELDEDQETVADVNGDGNINVQDVTLIMQYSLGIIDEFPDAALQVVSVEAVNARQVEVEFNKLVDKTKAENELSYEVFLSGAPYTNVFRTSTQGANAALQSDGKTVLLTLDGNATYSVKYFINGTSQNKVVVKEAVGLSDDYINSNVTYLDSTTPKFESASSSGTQTVILTFSEPVYDGGVVDNPDPEDDEIKLTDSYGAIYDLDLDNLEFNDAKRQVMINLESGSLVSGRTYNVTILSGSNLKDYGFNSHVSPAIKQFVHSHVIGVPSVSAQALNSKTVRLTFDRPVYLDTTGGGDLQDLEFSYNYWVMTRTGDDLDGVSTEFADTLGEAKSQFDIVFPNPMTVGPGTLHIRYTSGDVIIRDTWGNLYPNYTVVDFTVPETTAPFIVSARVIGAEHVALTYSKPVTYGGDPTEVAGQFTYVPESDPEIDANEITKVGDDIILRFPGAGFAPDTLYPNDAIVYNEHVLYFYRIRDVATDEEAVSPDERPYIYSDYE